MWALRKRRREPDYRLFMVNTEPEHANVPVWGVVTISPAGTMDTFIPQQSEQAARNFIALALARFQGGYSGYGVARVQFERWSPIIRAGEPAGPPRSGIPVERLVNPYAKFRATILDSWDPNALSTRRHEEITRKLEEIFDAQANANPGADTYLWGATHFNGENRPQEFVRASSEEDVQGWISDWQAKHPGMSYIHWAVARVEFITHATPLDDDVEPLPNPLTSLLADRARPVPPDLIPATRAAADRFDAAQERQGKSPS